MGTLISYFQLIVQQTLVSGGVLGTEHTANRADRSPRPAAGSRVGRWTLDKVNEGKACFIPRRRSRGGSCNVRGDGCSFKAGRCQRRRQEANVRAKIRRGRGRDLCVYWKEPHSRRREQPCEGPEAGSAWLPLQLYLGRSFPSHSHSLLAPRVPAVWWPVRVPIRDPHEDLHVESQCPSAVLASARLNFTPPARRHQGPGWLTLLHRAQWQQRH